jgi:2-polyprenyl-6-hydroxyphenyl methylase/3-demethylubiquinone-9 3-methyltransferase
MTERALTDRELSSSSAEFVWDEHGASEAHGYLLAPIVSLLRRYGARTVLDLGCGNGAFSNRLREQQFEVTSMDASTSGIRIAQRSHPQMRFVLQDVTQPLPVEYHRRYDAVVSTEVIEHLLLPRALLSNASLALRAGGCLILSTPFHGYWKNLLLALSNRFDTHWHPLRDHGHVKFFSKATILRLFEELGFVELGFMRVGRIPPVAKSMIVSGRLLRPAPGSPPQ